MYANHFAKRSIYLDLIRMAAITLVVGFHVSDLYDRASLDPVAFLFGRYGFYGVDLFFPLSGFLITRYLITTERPDFVRTFFLRRIFRILPLYVAAVTLFVVASLITGVERDIIDRVWIDYLFLTGWFMYFDGRATVPYSITWSLSVEEFAYILFGLYAWFNRRSFPGFLTAMILFAVALRFYLNTLGHDAIYYLPPARVDAIAIGGITAVLLHQGRPFLLPLFAAATVLCWFIADQSLLMRQTFFPLAISFGVGVLMLLAEQIKSRPGGPVLTGLAKIGFYSYFIYLIHYFNIYGIDVALRVLNLGLPNFWVLFALAMGVTYVQAALSYRWFEGPMIEYGRRLERRRAAMEA